MIIKYYGSEWINLVLKWYFVVTGVGSVWAVSVVFDHSSAAWVFKLVRFTFTMGLSDVQVIGSFHGWQHPLAVV